MKILQAIRAGAWLLGGLCLAFGTLPAASVPRVAQTKLQVDSQSAVAAAQIPAPQSQAQPPAVKAQDCSTQDDCGAQPARDPQSDPDATPKCTVQDNCGAQPLTDTEEQTQGISGSITIGPHGGPCPADQSCSGPYQTQIVAIDANGNKFITDSDAAGHFYLALAPGQYAVTNYDSSYGDISNPPAHRAAGPSCESVQVTVTAGQVTAVELSCDSGMD